MKEIGVWPKSMQRLIVGARIVIRFFVWKIDRERERETV